MRRIRSSGFTMLELLIGVVVVAILAAIAIPSYSAYVIRGQRAAAKAALEQAAQYVERNYTTSGCYNYTAPSDCQKQSGTALPLPATLAYAPVGGGVPTYAIGLGAAPPGIAAGQGFTLTATPCGDGSVCTAPGSNLSFKDLDCDVLSLDNTGSKTATGNVGSNNPSACWDR
jgi:type IV pilus assembly protein PilE